MGKSSQCLRKKIYVTPTPSTRCPALRMVDTFKRQSYVHVRIIYTNYGTREQTVLTISVDEGFCPVGSFTNEVLEDSLHSCNIHC